MLVTQRNHRAKPSPASGFPHNASRRALAQARAQGAVVGSGHALLLPGRSRVTWALVAYTGLRVLAFVGSYGLLLLAGLRGLVAVAGALLISSVLSLFALRHQRDGVATALERRRVARTAEQARLRGLLDASPDGSAPEPGPR